MRKTGWILLAVIFLAACKKNRDRSFEGVGTLTGTDDRKCACCGGVYVTIDNIAGQYRIHKLPSMTQEELRNLDFPRRIELEYRNDGNCGDDRLIEVVNYTLIP